LTVVKKKIKFVSMELSNYIKDLLYRYECVILPGFGAFLTQYRTARIDSDHNFYPPGKTLSFNRQLQTNDGILANYLATVEGCSYELALQKIRNFTGEISLKLSEGAIVSLQNIGEFSLNKERNVQFIPSDKENFSRDSFGLTSFASHTILRDSLSEASKLIALDPTKHRSRIPIFRYAAIGLIAITLGGFSGLKIYENQVEKYNFAERQKANNLLENQIQEATFEIANPFPALTLSVPKKMGKYHIVAGAFRVEENAQHKVSELTELGFPAHIIGVNKYGLHQVIYSSYQDRVEALHALRDIKNSKNMEAWLLVQELP
jgi:nucleoid DNA-binding protein